jgi:KDO2-lipid IV(A) lauroyltransferase
MIVKIVYYLIIKPLSLLPLSITYRLADFTYLILYKIFGYRKQVVWENISNSFPNLSVKERKEIMNKFYHHLCDLIIESIHLFSIKLPELQKRIKYRNPEVVNAFYEKGKSVIICGGHYNNWEYAAISFNLDIKHQAAGIYTPLTNKFFNKKMHDSRSEFGMDLIAKLDVKKYFTKNKNQLSAIIFAIDQSPTYSRKVYWTKFLNQETPVAFGTERYCRIFDYPVVFAKIYKMKRGHYEVEYETICEDPSKSAHGEITEKSTKLLESIIAKEPQYWLWTHKRWKRKRKEGE